MHLPQMRRCLVLCLRRFLRSSPSSRQMRRMAFSESDREKSRLSRAAPHEGNCRLSASAESWRLFKNSISKAYLPTSRSSSRLRASGACKSCGGASTS